jgi:hypothetical protein
MVCVCLVDERGREELDGGVNNCSPALAFSEWHDNAVQFQPLAMLQIWH